MLMSAAYIPCRDGLILRWTTLRGSWWQSLGMQRHVFCNRTCQVDWKLRVLKKPAIRRKRVLYEHADSLIAFNPRLFKALPSVELSRKRPSVHCDNGRISPMDQFECLQAGHYCSVKESEKIPGYVFRSLPRSNRFPSSTTKLHENSFIIFVERRFSVSLSVMRVSCE